jgi:hypothetical protein
MLTDKGDPAACLFLFVGQSGSRVGKLRGTACAGFGTKMILIVPEGRKSPQYIKWPMTMILVFNAYITIKLYLNPKHT